METSVVDVPDRGRFEIRLGERVVGLASYHVENGTMTLPHTEIDPSVSEPLARFLRHVTAVVSLHGYWGHGPNPAVYVGGDSVSYNGRKWTAKWWTQGDPPGGQAGVWTDNGSC